MIEADMVGLWSSDLKAPGKITVKAPDVKVWAGWGGKYIPEWSK
jgi:hypothetical protein